MAGIKISALPAVSGALLTDFFPVVQAGVTSQETLTQVLALFQGKITSLGMQVAALDMGSHLINNVTDPVSLQDAATKNYVDTVAQGLTFQGACRVATTTALTVTYANGASGVGATLTNAGVQAALAIDGVTLALNDRVLVKNQASTLQNGIYTVTNLGSGATNWVMTRAADYDQPAEVNPGDLVLITSGTSNANSSWVQTATVVTIGVSAITFSQFSASLPITVPNGGTGGTTFTAYGVVTAGTTATGVFQSVTPGAAGTILQSGGAASLPTWTTTIYPATNAINTIMYASAANVLGSISAVNGGVLVSDNTGVPSMLANPAAANRILLSGNAAIPAWSTTTYPATNAINTLMYASAANALSTLATVNNGTLTTNGSGVPTWLTQVAITKVSTQTITATGAFTYTPTSGTQYAIFELQAGGGGSGGCGGGASQGGAAGGGGGGAYMKILVNGSANLAAITGSVGAAGTAGASGASAGGAGGNTTLVINSGSTWTAGGGGGSTGSAASAGAVIVAGGAAGTNTTGTNGTLISNIPGQTGPTGFIWISAIVSTAAGGGDSFLGKGGNGGHGVTVLAGAGANYGGGGGGTSNGTGANAAGAAGAQGTVIVTEFISI